MNNGFRDDELVMRRQKVNGEWVESCFPRVGGRLRLAHDANENLSIQTDVVRFDDTCAVVKATAMTLKGSFSGFGTASASRDQRLADSLLELAETRSIARALRFSGYGMEFTGAEEVSHIVPDAEPTTEQSERKPKVIVPDEHQNEPPASIPAKNNGNGTGGRATQAQCRALYALSKRTRMCEEDVDHLLSPLNASRFEDLSVADASRLIHYLQTQAAA